MKFAIGVSIALAIIGWNYVALKGVQSPYAAVVERAAQDHAARSVNAQGLSADDAIELPWTLLENLKLPGKTNAQIEFSKELEALNGKFVYVPGVFTPLTQLKSGDAFNGGVLQPPNKIACCGLTCDPRTQLLIFVDCTGTPWTSGPSRALVSVVGKLELVRENSAWGCTSLSQVTLAPLK